MNLDVLSIFDQLDFSKLLTENGAYVWEDRIVFTAHKNQGGKKLPLVEGWRRADFLKAIPNGRYCNRITGKFTNAEGYQKLDYREIPDWAPVNEYSLNHAALKWFDKKTDSKSILNDIRLEVKNNDFNITLTGILMARAPESRLKLLVETIQALWKAGIIKGKWIDSTAKTRPYDIIRKHFYVSLYEVKFDSGRYGSAFYNKCKATSKWVKPLQAANKKAGGNFNQVPLFSPDAKQIKNRGFEIVVYDRSLKPENRKSDPRIFPFRLEVKLKKRLLEGKCWKNSPCIQINDLIKGNGKIVIHRLKAYLTKVLEKGVCEMKAPLQFDIFVNKKRSGKTPRQAIEDLITNGTMLDKIDYCLKKSKEHDTEIKSLKETINDLLVYHGRTLPNQRGLKVI